MASSKPILSKGLWDLLQRFCENIRTNINFLLWSCIPAGRQILMRDSISSVWTTAVTPEKISYYWGDDRTRGKCPQFPVGITFTFFSYNDDHSHFNFCPMSITFNLFVYIENHFHFFPQSEWLYFLFAHWTSLSLSLRITLT